MFVALVIAASAIAASLVVRKRVRSNGARRGNAISVAWLDDSIIGIGNALTAAVSLHGHTHR